MSNSPINIIGISCLYHDSAAVLMTDGEIMAACQEERITRVKFENNFPINSIYECLSITKLTINNIDEIAFYEEPLLKLDRIVDNLSYYSFYKLFNNTKIISDWIKNKLFIEEYIKYYFPTFKGKITFYKHHLSHAASAFFPSPYKEATVVCIDGVGERSCTSISIGSENKIKVLEEQFYPHSLGFLYSTFTQFLGFKVDSGEYKLMGLAPYGKPVYKNIILDNIICCKDNGEIKLNLSYFDFLKGDKMYSNKFSEIFKIKNRLPEEKITPLHMDIASSIQSVTENIIGNIVDYAIDLTKINDLCLAGGVALNCVANGKLLQNKKINNIWVQPASGDSGCALGAAYLSSYNNFGLKRVSDGINDKQKFSALGTSFNNEEIKKVLDTNGLVYESLKNNERSRRVAFELSKGKVVSIFNGRMEFGPRALGKRSILGDPRDKDMQKVMNLKIKFREDFRPFAPIIKEDKLKDWYESDYTSPYMLFVSNLKKNKIIENSKNSSFENGFEKLKLQRSLVPAVTHVDYSSRIQTVSNKSNALLYDILNEFEKITNIPILINTSFNIRGEPIVFQPIDALICFMNTDIDCLLIENFFLIKEKQNDILVDKDFKNSFAKD